MTRKLKIGNEEWIFGKKTYIMGILNVTPDSFSDGGKFDSLENAFEHAKRLAAEGADIIDLGGESTRPGYEQVPAKEEIRRIVPVLETVAAKSKVPFSIDTYKAETAEAAIKAGASMLNDIWGLKYDPEMAQVAAKYKVPICIMHNREKAQYDNLMEDMLRDLSESINIALRSGIEEGNIIIDPGVGFGKTFQDNLMVMRNLEQLKRLGYPVLLGTSRKGFIGKVLDLPVNERVEGTIATTVTGIIKGADIVRVHDVLQNKRAAAMTDTMVR